MLTGSAAKGDEAVEAVVGAADRLLGAIDMER